MFAIFEIMPMSEGISRLIVDRPSTSEIERLAIDDGMQTLRVTGMRRVVRGDVSVEELVRVTG